jgi:hypothetical protein
MSAQISHSAQPTPLTSKKLLDQVREKARLAHLSLRTEKDYLRWLRARIGRAKNSFALAQLWT